MTRLALLGLVVGLSLPALGCDAPAPTRPPAGDAGPGPTPTPPGPRVDAGPGVQPPPTGAPCPADAQARFDALAASFRTALAAESVPGGVLVVVCGGSTVRIEAVGVRRRGGAEPITAQTRFQLASSTKMFTGVLGLALERAGTVDLSAPVSTYLPGTAWGDATLEQLLAHTAGYPPDFDVHDDTLEGLVERNRSQALWSRPGAVWNYSNPGFSVAGAALARAAGRPFPELVQTHVLGPAGLSATFDVTAVMAGDYAAGHDTDPRFPPVIEPNGAYFHTGYYGPMGGLWGSAEDVARWIQIHLGAASGLDPAIVARTHAPVTRTTSPGRGYAYGHFVDDGLSPAIVHHGGSTPGYLTQIEAIPEAGFGVAVLVNAGSFDLDTITYEAEEAFASITTIGPAPEPAPDLYVGSYVDPQSFGRVEITASGAQLTARFRDRGEQSPLTHQYADSYTATYQGEEIDLSFWRQGSSPATHIVSLWGVAERAP